MADHGTLTGDRGSLCLALETATATASVALLHGEGVVGVRRSAPGRHHSETLLPMIDALLTEAACPLDAVDVFAVSIGPGGFTSLRIGLGRFTTEEEIHYAVGRIIETVEKLRQGR